MEEARRSPWEIYTPGSLEGKMSEQRLWVAVERGGEIHLTEIMLTDDIVLLIEAGGMAVMRNINEPQKTIVFGELLAFAVTPELFKLAFSISSRAGEKAICHPLDGPGYKLYKVGEG
jgi:hypothetical protein